MRCIHCKGETFEKKGYCEDCILELKELRNRTCFGLGWIAFGVVLTIISSYMSRAFHYNFSFVFYGAVIYGIVQIVSGLSKYHKTKNVRIFRSQENQQMSKNLEHLLGRPDNSEFLNNIYLNNIKNGRVDLNNIQKNNIDMKNTGSLDCGRKQSSAGVFTFVISIINALLNIIAISVYIINRAFTPTYVNLSMLYILLLFVALIVGIIGLLQRKKDKKYAKIGMIAHAITFGVYIISFIVLAVLFPISLVP